MQKFHFSLDSALSVRTVQLRSAEAKLKELLAGDQRLRKSLAMLAKDRAEASVYLPQHSTDALAIRALSSYLLGIEMRRNQLSHTLKALAASIHEQRGVVAAVERAVKLLTKLRDKRYALWQLENNREIEALAQECWLATHCGPGKL